MNNLYELGGNVNVLIKPIVETVIGNKTYKAYEPFTILQNVEVELLYRDISSNIMSKKNIISVQDGWPTQVSINKIPFTKKIGNLILTKQGNVSEYKTLKEQITAQDNKLYTNNNIESNNVFIYNLNKEKQSYTQIIDNCIEGIFNEGENYLVFYETKIKNTIYSFDIPHYPYFCLEIFGIGNEDKTTSSFYIKFPAVSFVSLPNMNIVNDSILNTPIIADIIYYNNNKPIISFGD